MHMIFYVCYHPALTSFRIPTVHSSTSSRATELHALPARTAQRHLPGGALPKQHAEAAHRKKSWYHQGTSQG